MLLQLVQSYTLFSWGFAILFNVLPGPIYVFVITQGLQTCKPGCKLNLILFPNLQFIYLLEIKSFPIKLCATGLLIVNLSLIFAITR